MDTVRDHSTEIPRAEVFNLDGNSDVKPLPATADDALRVAVGDPSGLRSGTWRIWFGPYDIFAGYRSVAHMRKVSVHYPRPGHEGTLRYIGYTSDYSEEHGLPNHLPERAQHAWPGYEFANGYFVEFRIRIPRTELRRFLLPDSRDTHWLPPPPAQNATEITIVSGPPSHEGLVPQMAGDSPRELLAEFRLPNGRYVWIMHHHIPTPSGAEMQAVRERVRQEWLNMQRTGTAAKILPKTRVGADTNCGDGSFAEVELAADFLLNRKRRTT